MFHQKIKIYLKLAILIEIIHISISLYLYMNSRYFEKSICVVTSIVQRKTKYGNDITYYRNMLNSLPHELYVIVRTEIPLEFGKYDRKPDMVIDVKEYPEMEKLNDPAYIPTYGDTLSRTRWRSKQTLDMATMLNYGAERFDYVLFLEDDTVALDESSLILWLNDFISNHKNDIKWGFAHLEHYPQNFKDKSIISYGGSGATALLIPSTQVNIFVPYLRQHFDKSPCDWLIRDFVHKNNLNVYGASPPLFKHMGKTSSLTEKN